MPQINNDNRALQDLVNYLAFKVEYGRDRGIQDQIGFDGFWQSPYGFNIVVEVKTTEGGLFDGIKSSFFRSLEGSSSIGLSFKTPDRATGASTG